MIRSANLGASVAARLLKRAKRTGEDYQTLLTGFALERFLYRIGTSELRECFVLKGAMLLRLWSDQPYRATSDLDLLRRGDGGIEVVGEEIRTIMAAPAPADGVDFDAGSVRIERIRAEDDASGSRATFSARCGSARLSLRVDIGAGDVVWPAPSLCSYPSLLDLPAPEVLAYPREAVVAEKFEAIVALGDRNSRIKDYFDLRFLASRFEFDRATLAEAVRRTFERRNTPIPRNNPIGLTEAYWDNPSRPAQVRAFARRSGLSVPEDPRVHFVALLTAFFGPLLDDLRDGVRRDGSWKAGGPWR